MEPERGTTPQEPQPARPGLWHTWLSVAAAFFGVQSGRNRERDFRHGKASHFIVMALLMTLVLVLLVLATVRFALRAAGV